MMTAAAACGHYIIAGRMNGRMAYFAATGRATVFQVSSRKYKKSRSRNELHQRAESLLSTYSTNVSDR